MAPPIPDLKRQVGAFGSFWGHLGLWYMDTSRGSLYGFGSVLVHWNAPKRRTPGGQRRFAEVAISTTLLLGAVFRLPLRQTEGFVRSIVDLMGRDLPVPEHTTLSRRRRTVDVVPETGTNKRPADIVLDSTGLKFFGAGEWARARHGETRRSWRKLHISVDPARSEIRAHELTGDDTADATMAGSPVPAGRSGVCLPAAPMTGSP